jgi:GrpB-like predicted nucleotidyltransferase (UPF0157 family)
MNELILGVPRSEVRLASHDPRWLDCYTAAANDLKECLGNRLIAIEHVGSTAVPGLDAKPIIDIMVGVASLDLAPGFMANLEQLGYEHHPADTVAGRVFFSKGPESARTHHLSVCEVASDFWLRQTAFRDALRADSLLRQQYAALKQQLAQRYPRDRIAYTAAKEPFIHTVMTQARHQ